MRIDRLEIENFKKFVAQEIDLHPRFTLLVGENGSGKTTLLDALAVSMAIWLVKPPDSEVRNSGRKLFKSEIRLTPSIEGDRLQFRETPPAKIKAFGNIAGQEGVEWTRSNHGSDRTSDIGAKAALSIIQSVYDRDRRGEKPLCPVLAYYGAGRAWLPSNKRSNGRTKTGKSARRWAAFYDCFNERIRFAELQKWFEREASARGDRNGRWRPGCEVVRRAILRCVPEASDVLYNADLEQIVLVIAGAAQPFDNLSAGQRMMLALVADLAIKVVTQNAFLLPQDELGPESEWPEILNRTPGVVLIDELDVHLHPRWQRRVATDLKDTFPSIQFVCTSHSPQVIGEVTRDEVRMLAPSGIERPSVAFGADSNWILDHVLENSASETLDVRKLQEQVEEALSVGNLNIARQKLQKLRELIDGDTGMLVRLESSLLSLETLAEE